VRPAFKVRLGLKESKAILVPQVHKAQPVRKAQRATPDSKARLERLAQPERRAQKARPDPKAPQALKASPEI